MITLDCTTERGLTYIQRQGTIIATFEAQFGLNAVATHPRKAAQIDAMFSMDGVLSSIAEVKARDFTRKGLERFGTYLISYSKITAGAYLAYALKVPFLLIVGCMDDRIIHWPISDEDGTITMEMDVRVTETKANCNGGSAMRENAFIPVKHGYWL